ncbi:MAG: 50S ribosomal protein L30 [Gemmatimonadota bacterium]|nr:50S ribosomal protein L30 [Gemmatimonadota bacterium]
MAKKQAKQLRITQVRSDIGQKGTNRRTLLALGIKRHQHSVVHEDTPAIRGMIEKIGFMVDVEELE